MYDLQNLYNNLIFNAISKNLIQQFKSNLK